MCLLYSKMARCYPQKTHPFSQWLSTVSAIVWQFYVSIRTDFCDELFMQSCSIDLTFMAYQLHKKLRLWVKMTPKIKTEYMALCCRLRKWNYSPFIVSVMWDLKKWYSIRKKNSRGLIPDSQSVTEYDTGIHTHTQGRDFDFNGGGDTVQAQILKRI